MALFWEFDHILDKELISMTEIPLNIRSNVGSWIWENEGDSIAKGELAQVLRSEPDVSGHRCKHILTVKLLRTSQHVSEILNFINSGIEVSLCHRKTYDLFKRIHVNWRRDGTKNSQVDRFRGWLIKDKKRTNLISF